MFLTSPVCCAVLLALEPSLGSHLLLFSVSQADHTLNDLNAQSDAEALKRS